MTVKDKEFKILIATPCYAGVCFAGYTLSLLKTFSVFQNAKNIKLTHKFILYDSLVPRARNHFAAVVLADPSITHLLFIDADIKWEPEDIVRLLSRDKLLVGAAVAKKRYQWEKLRSPAVKAIVMDDKISDVEFKEKIKANLVDYAINLGSSREVKEGLLAVEHIGTSFMLIAREVLEKMSSTFPELKVIHFSSELPPDLHDHFYCLFELGLHEGRYISEDYSFCRRWREMGGEIFADLSIKLTHQGQEDYYSNLLALGTSSKKPI